MFINDAVSLEMIEQGRDQTELLNKIYESQNQKPPATLSPHEQRVQAVSGLMSPAQRTANLHAGLESYFAKRNNR